MCVRDGVSYFMTYRKWKRETERERVGERGERGDTTTKLFYSSGNFSTQIKYSFFQVKKCLSTNVSPNLRPHSNKN